MLCRVALGTLRGTTFIFPYNLDQEPTNPWFGTVRHDRKVPLNKKKTNFVSPLIFIFAAVMTFTYSSEEIQ